MSPRNRLLTSALVATALAFAPPVSSSRAAPERSESAVDAACAERCRRGYDRGVGIAAEKLKKNEYWVSDCPTPWDSKLNACASSEHSSIRGSINGGGDFI